MPNDKVIVRCASCGHFILETDAVNGESRVKCSDCKRFVIIRIHEGAVSTTIEPKKSTSTPT